MVNEMVYVFLANGFEEVEALVQVDMLRRCELDVKTVGISGQVCLLYTSLWAMTA